MSWSDAQDHFATTLPGYEDRQQQTKLAQGIEKGLANGKHLMAQASTGTGKSFAALVPAIEHSMATGLPVVIATETKALQAQYTHSDVPFLKANLGIPFEAVQLKGKSNFICQAQIHALKPGTVANQDSLLEELESDPAHTGDLEDLVTEIDPRQRNLLTITSDECPGASSCPFGHKCYPEIAKDKAKTAQIIIVNHHLLVTDIKLRLATEGRAGVLPEYGALILDEAHGFLDVATSVLGEKFTEKSLAQLGNDIANFADELKAAEPLKAASTTLFRKLSGLLKGGKTAPLTPRNIFELTEDFGTVSDQILRLAHVAKEVSVHGSDEKALRRGRLIRRANKLRENLLSVVLSDSDDLVRWISIDDFGKTSLEFAPLDVGPTLRKNLWNFHPTTLMSATLAIGDDFSFLASQLGFTDFSSFDAGTPFNYATQSALYCPRGADPTKGDWRTKVAMTISELVKASEGRALLLFTSRRELNAAWEATHELIEDLGYTTLRQEAGGNNRVLGETFKSDEHSVLYALKSFMTGFDAKGDALRLLVLNKLPFAAPDDVILKARCDALDAKARNKWVDGGFPRITVPSMALVFLQAFGRLIRTREDHGLVVLLDERIWTKGYGKKIVNALPDAKRLDTLDEARQYLRSLG